MTSVSTPCPPTTTTASSLPSSASACAGSAHVRSVSSRAGLAPGRPLRRFASRRSLWRCAASGALGRDEAGPTERMARDMVCWTATHRQQAGMRSGAGSPTVPVGPASTPSVPGASATATAVDPPPAQPLVVPGAEDEAAGTADGAHRGAVRKLQPPLTQHAHRDVRRGVGCQVRLRAGGQGNFTGQGCGGGYGRGVGGACGGPDARCVSAGGDGARAGRDCQS
eukprot:scaffold2718_cov103-Isochrysis_galbana.AAC.6